MNSYMKNKFVKSIPSEVSIKQTDRKLRELICERLPQAPEDVWFSQKVMNRLPEKGSVSICRWPRSSAI